MLALGALKAKLLTWAAGGTLLALAAFPVGGSFPDHVQRAIADIETVDLILHDGRTLGISRYEVSWGDWRACHDDGGCSVLPERPDAFRTRHFPVTGVSYLDVQEFLVWVNRRSGRHWRLPTAAEWRQAATELQSRERPPLFTDPRLAWAANYGATESVPKRLQPRGTFGTFSNGISDLAGNVWEWTSTCAANGAGIMEPSRCPAMLVEGLHESAVSVFIRDPATGGCSLGEPPANIGFRLVSDD